MSNDETATGRKTARGYAVRHPWPEDCFVQGGESGLVISRSGQHYGTAFFEAFPTAPKTFIRGEGKTQEEAEDAAWAKYQRVASGDHEHVFETRGYRNGAGFCTHCGLFQSGVFDLAEIGSVCDVCGVGTYYKKIGEKLYCQEHAPSDKEYLRQMDELRKNGAVGQMDLEEVFVRMMLEDENEDD